MHAFLVQKSSLGAVAMMRVIIDDRDTVQSMGKCIPRCDGYIVEDAKPHGAIRLGVMPGRAHDGEGVFCTPIQDRPTASNDSTGSQQGILKRRRGHICRRVIDNAWRLFSADFSSAETNLGSWTYAISSRVAGSFRCVLASNDLSSGLQYLQPPRPFRMIRINMIRGRDKCINRFHNSIIIFPKPPP